MFRLYFGGDVKETYKYCIVIYIIEVEWRIYA